MNKRLRVGVASLGLAFVLAIVVGATGVVVPKNQRTAAGASTTLTIITGTVLVRHGTGEFNSAADGALLGPGDTIKTGPDARAVLTYFEGSTVEIEPGSELSIDTARANPDGSTVIVMKQELGVTWHVVTHLVQGGSRYEVHTSAATASVRGTAFAVGVEPDLSTTVTTTEGNVAASDPGVTKVVEVTPGLTTTTKNGEKPQEPKPAPESDRKVTVTVGDQNTLIVDPLGRANGIKNGKKIAQTPGAQVSIVAGKLVITMPNLPDGDIATHFLNTSNRDDVEVSTKVEEKGKKAVEVKETVKPSTTSVTGVEVKKTKDSSSGDTEETTVRVKKVNDQKKPKVGETPPTLTTKDRQKAAENAKNKDTSNKYKGATGGTGLTAKSNDRGGTIVNNKTTPQLPKGGFIPGINVGPLPQPKEQPRTK